MTDLPARRIDELVARWTVAGLPLVVVEGPFDERFLALLQREDHCPGALAEVDVASVDAIDVPAPLLEKHAVAGAGAKHRVVAFAREVVSLAAAAGFRGVIDRDLDGFRQIDLHSETVLYTDHGCLEAYLWTPDVLRRLLVQFQCERAIERATTLRALYDSINLACSAVAAVRLAALRNPDWTLSIHHSDKALGLVGKRLELKVPKYVLQANPARGTIRAVQACVDGIRVELQDSDPLDLLNGHDLVWLITFALRGLSNFPRRLVDEETISSSLVSYGVMHPALTLRPLFVSLCTWANQGVA